MNSQLRIWHVGNWCIHIGRKYVESRFEAPSKDVEVLNYAQPFVDALRAIPTAEVVSQPSWELYHLSPEAFDERLKWATTIIFAERRPGSGRVTCWMSGASPTGASTS